MDKRKRVYWLILALVLAAILIVAAVSTDLSLLKRFTLGSIALLILLNLLGSGLDTLRTWIILRGMGYRVSPGWLSIVETSTLWMTYTTPARFGVPAKVYLLRKMFDVPVSDGSACVVMLISLGTLTTAAIAFVGVFTLLDATWLRVPLAAFLGLLLLGASALAAFSEHLEQWARTRTIPVRLEPVFAWGIDFLAGLRTIPRSAILISLALSPPKLLVITANLQVILSTLGVELPFWQLLTIRAASRVAGLLSMMPMGLGAQEATLAALLSSLGSPGGVSTLAVVLHRFATTGVLCVLGVIAASVLSSRLLGPSIWLKDAGTKPETDTANSRPQT
jgi:uncharacterized protein (TIRG00374 family)